VQTGSYIPNPTGTPTAVTQFTNNQWLGTGASYDAAGDATGVPGSTNETFTYDAENRVNTANANGTITYIYDGQGRRVEKTASTFSTIYLYDAADKAIVETTVPVTGTSFPTDAPVTGTEYLIEDHLGSTRLSMNNQGQVVRRYDFLPFGEEIVAGVGGRGADYEPSNYVYPTTPDDVLHKFTSKERDSETGLDFFGARYFSSAEGRFTSPDRSTIPVPVPYADFWEPQTLNIYSYATNNPLSVIDKVGHAKNSSNIKDMGAGWTMRIDTRGADHVNVHFEKSGKDIKYDLKGGKLVPAHDDAAPKWLLKKAQRILEDTGKFEMAAEKGAFSGAKVTDDAPVGGTAASIAILQLADIGLQALQQLRSQQSELETGYHLDLAGERVVTNLAKYGDNEGPGASVTVGDDKDVFTLGDDGKWLDQKGNQLNQSPDGQFYITHGKSTPS